MEFLTRVDAARKQATVDALLAAGADVNRRSYRQRTALHAAAMASAGPTREASLRIIASLLRAGAWTQARDGLAPLALAARERSRGRMLHGEGDASAPHNDFYLAVARELRWTPAVRLLWLGQRSGDDSVLAKLDRDTLLLVCRFAVEGDVDPDEAGTYTPFSAFALPNGEVAAAPSGVTATDFMELQQLIHDDDNPLGAMTPQ